MIKSALKRKSYIMYICCKNCCPSIQFSARCQLETPIWRQPHPSALVCHCRSSATTCCHGPWLYHCRRYSCETKRDGSGPVDRRRYHLTHFSTYKEFRAYALAPFFHLTCAEQHDGATGLLHLSFFFPSDRLGGN